MFKKALMASAMIAALSFGAQSAQAGVIQLGFILDSSGSIGSGNWSTITTGLGNAISALIPTNSTYEVSVLTFGSSTQTIVNHVLIDSAATRTSVAGLVAAAPYIASNTNMNAAFTNMTSILTSSPLTNIDFSYVNLATDGNWNTGGDPTAAIGAMKAAGIDNISVEAIGSGVDVSFLQGVVCWPQSCDTTSPYDFPGHGFYLYVADASEYVDAIQTKIKIVTNQTPEPATLALVGAGLAGGAWLRRRRNKAAA